MNQDTKFLVFKYKNGDERKLIFQGFSFNKGKITFLKPYLEFKPDRRLRWKSFYNPMNKVLIMSDYLFLVSEGLIFIASRPEGNVIQTIGFTNK